MDLIEIDAASNRGIDEIRDLREKINFQPSQLQKKFYIIDEVHMLTEPAFNALLKTLEEPPPHAIFVLATTDPQDIPETVVSRCQRFDFQRIGLEQIAARLSFICGQEKIKFEPAALELVARQATGSLRDALSLLDQLVVFSDGIVTAQSVKTMLGVMNSEVVVDFVESLIVADMAEGLEQINKLVQSGSDLKRFNREVVDHLRGLMLLKANPAARELLDLPQETLDQMAKQAGRLDLNSLVALLKIFSGVDYNLKVSPYAQLPLELALMEALLARPMVAPPAQVVATPQTQAVAPVRPVVRPTPVLQALPPEPEEDEPPIVRPTPMVRPLGQTAQPKPTPAEPVKSAKPTPPIETPSVEKSSAEKSSDKVLALTTVQQNWGRLRDAVGATQKMIQALLADAQPQKVDGNVIVLSFKYEFHCEKVSQEKNRAFVEEQYSKLLGQQVLIRCIFEGKGGGSGSADGGSPPRNGPNGIKPSGPVMDDRSRRAAQIFNAVAQDVD
jgi:DNA polymerase-3 subunit gamma/tau